MIPRDKLWHFLASCGMVWIWLAILTIMEHYGYCRCCCYDETETRDDSMTASRQQPSSLMHHPDEYPQQDHSLPVPVVDNHESTTTRTKQHYFTSSARRIVLASFLAFLVGTAKEVADVIWDGWPWCSQGDCHGDGWDILANLLGIVMGAGMLLAFVGIVNAMPMSCKDPNHQRCRQPK